jgi:hypothetical protein
MKQRLQAIDWLFLTALLGVAGALAVLLST